MPPPTPGFDGLRLLAACGVLLAHGMLMPGGDVGLNPLERALEHGGVLAVGVFFILSGYLLAGSLERDGDALRFAVHRVLRIVPGLAACTLFTALVLGALGTRLLLDDYLRDPAVPDYIALTLDCLCTRALLPGVWSYTGNPEMSGVVNGSLWSMSYEALSYVLLLALWLATRRIAATALALLALALLTTAWPPAHQALQGLAFTLPAFAAGAVMHLVTRRVALRADLAAACAAVFAVSAALGWAWPALCTVGAYALVWAGTRPNPLSRFAARHGDLSYGVYLYGWPVQQLVRTALPEASAWSMLAVSLPVVLALAWLSHHAVERPALRARHAVVDGLQRVARGVGPAGRRLAAVAFVIGSMVWLLAPGHAWWWVGRGLIGLALLAAAAAVLGRAAAATRRALRAG